MNLLRHCMIAGALVSALFAYSLESSAQTRLWGTYYGGDDAEGPGKVITDSSGNTFVIGHTASDAFIATPNAFDPFLDVPPNAYLAKFDTNGKLVWATYYGDGNNTGWDLGLDGAGNIYVIGTQLCPSTGLATRGAHDGTCTGDTDMFLAKFSPQGKRLWGTYFGGSGKDTGGALSVSAIGYVYVTGSSESAQGIVPLPSPDPTYGGAGDAVIAKFSSTGNLMWARYFGGSSVEYGQDIACKGLTPTAPDQCYVTGLTASTSGIASAGVVHDSVLNGPADAFLAKIDSTSGQTVWSTYYGGSAGDEGISLAVDKKFNVFLGGMTMSPDAMATMSAHDTTYNGDADMFLARFTADGVRQAGTYYGSPGEEFLRDVAVDADSNVYIAARVSSSGDFATPNAFDAVFNETYNVVLTKFNPVLVRLWSTYYGNGFEEAGGVAISTDNHIHLFGWSIYSGLATPGAHKFFPIGGDVFLAEFSQ